ncbi:hypothetical protein B0O99DRAFT_714445 [Bisporella sp. PMI_857]|nr:hypothetical protein B0O99DRAFT_714445 [Bisporella sp. PMI_857]
MDLPLNTTAQDTQKRILGRMVDVMRDQKKLVLQPTIQELQDYVVYCGDRKGDLIRQISNGIYSDFQQILPPDSLKSILLELPPGMATRHLESFICEARNCVLYEVLSLFHKTAVPVSHEHAKLNRQAAQMQILLETEDQLREMKDRRLPSRIDLVQLLFSGYRRQLLEAAEKLKHTRSATEQEWQRISSATKDIAITPESLTEVRNQLAEAFRRSNLKMLDIDAFEKQVRLALNVYMKDALGEFGPKRAKLKELEDRLRQDLYLFSG